MGLETAARGASEPESCPLSTVPEIVLEARGGGVEGADIEDGERLSFFRAIAAGDTRAVCLALNAGMDPDVEVPVNVPKEFVSGFEDERVRYYVGSEPGFSALMLASALGNRVLVEILLEAGATPGKRTRRHKTFPLWLAGRYGHVEIMRRLMGIGPGHEARSFVIEVCIADQEVRLFRNGQLLIESPVSTGKASRPTPTGTYVVTDKYKMWTSTLYDAKMPNFLRLSCGDFGLHAGRLPGYPASHGCIRLPAEKARELFAATPIGALVEIR